MFGYVAILESIFVVVGAWTDSKVASAKEAEMKAVLAALKEGREKGFA